MTTENQPEVISKYVVGHEICSNPYFSPKPKPLIVNPMETLCVDFSVVFNRDTVKY